jgi:hypothetical protein
LDGDLQRGVDRRIYVWAALACALIALTGFARTYYLKGLLGGPPLPFLLHVHGLIMSAWCVLFLTQTCLVATHRVRVHRRLGVFGVPLAILVVAISTYVTIHATAREIQSHVIGQFHFLFGFNLVNVLLFAALLSAGLTMRARPDFHKRLMLMATISILSPAIARATLLFTHNQTAQMLAVDCFFLIFVATDTIRHRRLHPAFGWGALLTLGSLNASYLAFQTDAWTDFVTRLFSR